MMSHAGILRRPWQIRGWHLFLLLLFCEAGMTWYFQTQVLTRDVYHSLLGEQLEIERIDALFDLFKRMSVWGYATLPLVLWLRIAFVAFLLQLPLVFRFIDIRFTDLFRIVLMASLLLVLLESSRLVHLSAIASGAITKADLSWIPLSVTSMLDLAGKSSAIQGFFSHFNLFELGWLAIIYAGLMHTGKLKKVDAGLVVLLMWTIIVVFQWGAMMYLERMQS